MNSRLAEHLRQRVNRGEARSVRICKDSAGFRPEITECHARVDKWVETHPGHKPIRGWAVIRTSLAVKPRLRMSSRTGLRLSIYLIKTTSTPISRLAQTRSTVTTGHPSFSARAKQARSPSDKPACRVTERSRAVVCACSSSKLTTR